MRVIFLAGPYRAATEYGVSRNIHRASEVAGRIWQLGAACVCPQMNTAFFGGLVDDEVWLAGDLEILARCDAVVTVPGWEGSVGAQGEIARARDLGIPVFHAIDELDRWLRDSLGAASPRCSRLL